MEEHRMDKRRRVTELSWSEAGEIFIRFINSDVQSARKWFTLDDGDDDGDDDDDFAGSVTFWVFLHS